MLSIAPVRICEPLFKVYEKSRETCRVWPGNTFATGTFRLVPTGIVLMDCVILSIVRFFSDTPSVKSSGFTWNIADSPFLINIRIKFEHKLVKCIGTVIIICNLFCATNQPCGRIKTHLDTVVGFILPIFISR